MTNTFLFSNNAESTLSAGITNVAITITLQAGDGALFPLPASDEQFPITLIDSSGNIEIAYCTTRVSDTLTVTRAQEGTTGLPFAINDTIELRVTSGVLDKFNQKPVTAGSIYGLELSNAVDADHDITIAVGECSNSTNSFLFKFETAITKQIDAIFAAGDNAGGLFSGAVAINTWYHVFLMKKDSDGTIDAGYSTLVAAGDIPAGYTAYRRIGSVLTDGAANILPFAQENDRFLWSDPLLDVNTTVGLSAASFTLSVPTGIKIEAIINATSSLSGQTPAVYLSSLDANDEAPSVTAAPLTTLRSEVNGNWATAKISILTNISSQIRGRSDLAATTLNIATLGWIDSRGQY